MKLYYRSNKNIFSKNKKSLFTKNNPISSTNLSNHLLINKNTSNNLNLFSKHIKFCSKNFSLKKLPNLRKYGEIKFNFKNLINDLPLHISNIKNRKVNADAEKVISLFEEYTKKVNDINLMRRQLNEMKTFSKEYAKSGKSLEQLSKDQKKHNQDISKFQDELASIEEKLMIEALKIPNQTHPDVPVGDESKAICLRVIGKKPEFDFNPLDHLEIGKKSDLFDFDNAAKITDSKFVLLKNEAALLEQALINYGVDKIIKKGYTFMTTPDICKNTIIEGCGFNPRDDSSASNNFILLYIFKLLNLIRSISYLQLN